MSVRPDGDNRCPARAPDNRRSDRRLAPEPETNMPLPLATLDMPKDADRYWTVMADPHLVRKLVSDSDLRGCGGALWRAFRYPDQLTLAQKAQAALYLSKLTRAQMAGVLFDVLLQILRRLGARYDSFANMPLFMPGAIGKDGSLDISCKGCTLSFAGLLYAFGFHPDQLKAHVSNVTTDPTVKVAMRPRSSWGDVRASNSGVSYDYDVSAPIHEELTNGFKLLSYPGDLFDVAMVPRDPFNNHYCLYVQEPGLDYAYFDPLTGARYRSGQDDLFGGYKQWTGHGLKYGGAEVEVFRHIDDPLSRLYRVPDKLDFPGNSDFGRARAKYAAMDGDLWLLIDADDWGPQLPVQRRRGAAQGASRFPVAAGGHRPAALHPDKVPRPLRDRPVRGP
jgi:hypothetical protein